MALALLALTTLVVAGSIGLHLVMRLRGRPTIARLAAVFAVTVSVAYAGALAVVNGRSEVAVLPPGSREEFCGAYLDCHVGFAVVGARATEVTGRPVRVVSIEVSSDALGAELAPPPLTLRLVDDAGRAYDRSGAVERSLGLSADLTTPIAPGSARRGWLAFEVPADVGGLRLRASMAHPLSRAVEALLLGDTHGLLHSPVEHALGG